MRNFLNGKAILLASASILCKGSLHCEASGESSQKSRTRMQVLQGPVKASMFEDLLPHCKVLVASSY
ncbi:hypothetical protein AKJ16_DCAP08821 [Drosera capensis]